MTKPETDFQSFARQVETCGRKKVFKGEGRARIYASKTLKRKTANTNQLWPYHCKFCAQWHLTSTPQPTTSVTKKNAFDPSGIAK